MLDKVENDVCLLTNFSIEDDIESYDIEYITTPDKKIITFLNKECYPIYEYNECGLPYFITKNDIAIIVTDEVKNICDIIKKNNEKLQFVVINKNKGYILTNTKAYVFYIN